MNKWKQWRGWVEEVKQNLLNMIPPEMEEKWKKEYEKAFKTKSSEDGK
jgi:hypothetical protein